MEQYVTTGPKSKEAQEMENALVRVFNSLYRNPILNSTSIVKGVEFTASTDVIVPHKLNRVPVGYIVINKTSPATLFTSDTENPFAKVQLILKSDFDTIADFLFF